ncbi:MAG: type I methionyl aminopeptidase [Mycobacteriales bacterium]
MSALRRSRPRGVTVKTPDQVARMRDAGLVVGRTLELLAAAVRPGVSTGQLDALAEQSIRSQGAIPSFLGYHGFPGSICASVGSEVVHGIPRPDRVLAEGELISIDCGAILEGWHGDAAVTVPVGACDPELLELSAVTERSLWAGLAAALDGGRLSDIGAAVEAVVRPYGYGVVDGYTGHGIGTAMHEPPYVPNVAPHGPGKGMELEAGIVLAVEPMLTLGNPDVTQLEDGWTVVTLDGRSAAHWEHTVAVTPDGPWVLTAMDGGLAGLASVRAEPVSAVPSGSHARGASPVATVSGVTAAGTLDPGVATA